MLKSAGPRSNDSGVGICAGFVPAEVIGGVMTAPELSTLRVGLPTAGHVRTTIKRVMEAIAILMLRPMNLNLAKKNGGFARFARAHQEVRLSLLLHR